MNARRSRRDAGRSTDDPSVGVPSGGGPAFGTPAFGTTTGGPPLWPGISSDLPSDLSSDTEPPAPAPSLDDVLPEPPASRGSDSGSNSRAGRRADAGRTPGRKKKSGRKAAAEKQAPGRRLSTARVKTRKAAVFLRRKPRGVLQRPAGVAGAAGVALLVGVACGMGLGTIGADPATEESTAPAASPESCAVAQVAWARWATAQVRMSADDPATLRSGFLGARDALADVQAPAAIASDWGTVTTYVDTVAEAVADVKDDDEVEAAVAGAVSGLDTPAMTAAAGRITTYLKADCNV